MTTTRHRPTWDLALDPLVSCKLCLGEYPLEQMTTVAQCQCVFCTLVGPCWRRHHAKGRAAIGGRPGGAAVRHASSVMARRVPSSPGSSVSRSVCLRRSAVSAPGELRLSFRLLLSVGSSGKPRVSQAGGLRSERDRFRDSRVTSDVKSAVCL